MQQDAIVTLSPSITADNIVGLDSPSPAGERLEIGFFPFYVDSKTIYFPGCFSIKEWDDNDIPALR